MPPSIPSKHASVASFGIWDPRGLGIYALYAQKGGARNTRRLTPTAAADMTTTPLQAERQSCQADAELSRLERRSRTAVGAVSDPLLRSRIPVRRYPPGPDHLCSPSPP